MLGGAYPGTISADIDTNATANSPLVDLALTEGEPAPAALSAPAVERFTPERVPSALRKTSPAPFVSLPTRSSIPDSKTTASALAHADGCSLAALMSFDAGLLTRAAALT
jgi:hypothetical protein